MDPIGTVLLDLNCHLFIFSYHGGPVVFLFTERISDPVIFVLDYEALVRRRVMLIVVNKVLFNFEVNLLIGRFGALLMLVVLCRCSIGSLAKT